MSRRGAEASRGSGGADDERAGGWDGRGAHYWGARAPVAVVDVATDLLAGGGGPVLTGLCGHILTEGLVGPVAAPAHLHPAAPRLGGAGELEDHPH